MNDAAWFAEDDPRSLPQRIARVLTQVREHAGAPCGRCEVEVCGHAVVFSIVSGHEDRPCCLDCIAAEAGREATAMRDQMVLFIHSKPCLTQGWRFASLREGLAAEALPACHFEEGEPAPVSIEADDDHEAAVGVPDDHFDAGDQGCGDLVLALRIRLNRMAVGSLLRLTATDPGAPEDIPAWCRLTGNHLVSASHPDYFIRRKED